MPTRFRPLAGGLFALGLFASGCDAGLSPDSAADGPAASALAGPSAAEQADARAASALAGRYIVVLAEAPAKAGARTRTDLDAVIAEARAGGAEVGHRYEHALTGFAARLSPEAVAALRADPRVAYVEADALVHAVGSGTQTGATWGLDRTDQRNRPLNSTYAWSTSGAGVTAYVIDTGIRNAHTDFGGRARSGYDFISYDTNTDDCNGHGTHVAGTVGGGRWGVAKDVALVGVRVLDCNGSGPISTVIAGVDWVAENHVKPAVANMSLGGSASSSLDAAVRNAIADGVAFSVAAGNGNSSGVAQNACNYSPARVAEAITISATDSGDRKASWANYGNCVDFFAPGVSITSAWYTSNTATAYLSGTSMAAPHVAGAAAVYLEANPTATPQQIRDALYNATTKGNVSSANTANNHLLYQEASAAPPPPPPPPPQITLAATGIVRPDGRWRVDLTWSGATSSNVDVLRDGSYDTTTLNDGAQRRVFSSNSSRVLVLKVCEERSSTACSNEVTLNF